LKLRLIQTSSNAIGSVYIFHDFLSNLEYLEKVKKLVIKEINKEPLENLANVMATTTDYKKLLQVKELRNFFIKILETLSNVYTLRTTAPQDVMEFEMYDAWGMRHKKGDFTLEHIHAPCAWSGAFYCEVPDETHMYFPDFLESYKLEKNMLILFPGITKHSVSEHTSEKERISMAFNISWKR
jgi:hypothetical protein